MMEERRGWNRGCCSVYVELGENRGRVVCVRSFCVYGVSISNKEWAYV